MDRTEPVPSGNRKVYLFMMTSLDGYFEGPNHELDWHNVDDEFDKFTIEQLSKTDTILFGRRTYQMMASFWPTKEAISSDPVVASFMNSLPKVIFSRTLEQVRWNNARLSRIDPAQEIQLLRSQPGKDIAILGSSNLSSGLDAQGLINEFRIMVNPVILGRGHPLLLGTIRRIDLKPAGARFFKSGNVLLTYLPRESSVNRAA